MLTRPVDLGIISGSITAAVPAPASAVKRLFLRVLDEQERTAVSR